ncbi:translation initiation factor IF-2 subunit beta [archaeon]|nr:translation initiation factor IF-2 subunit beta [archaeon]
MDYDRMLDRALMSLPEAARKLERFEMPVAESIIQGNKTIFRNFGQIIKVIGRDEKELFKFITKEFAVAAVIDEGKLVFNGKFLQEKIQAVVQAFIKEYVLCHECNRPDTRYETYQGVRMLKCTACGALSPLKKL